MFSRSYSIQILALVSGALFLHMVSAVSPCTAIKDYSLVYIPATGDCQCVNNDVQGGGPATETPNDKCTYTKNPSAGTCTATCPSGNQRRRRSVPQLQLNADRSIRNCPQGQTSCPITSSHGSSHECVNTKTDLDNCGGCAALGQGVICGKEPGVRTASCDNGVCHTHSCRNGYSLDAATKKCNRVH